MDSQPKIEKFYLCECHANAIMIGKDDECKLIDISLWSRGERPIVVPFFWSWKERLRWCWQIIRKGKPWSDAVIFDYATAEAMAKDILSLVSEKKTSLPTSETREQGGV